ncbi:archaeosortase A [Halomarina oriensis]|uniref:Archaeosortase A n=1 Tax=Halomarina oriensis TaxID=671145 RepID=A0A6B0GI80_9EURY|nr:archaeosortase A [Halomarina oriensis]MWG33511.1 archaeosortase A [Halomarina oriensis]
MASPTTDLLAWLVVGLFTGGSLLVTVDRRLGRSLCVLAWGVFAVFWALLVPHFTFVVQSAIEGVAAAVAVPGCLYAGYLLARGRDSLLVLSRAVGVMGLIYLPFLTSDALRGWLIETVAVQTQWGINLLGYSPELMTSESGYESLFVFRRHGLVNATEIVLMCTGLGSLTIFGGLIAAVDAPLRRKLQAAAVSIPVIYALNLVRNVFIAVAFGDQWFQWLYGPANAVFALDSPELASFYVADRVLAQSLSVVALVAILWLVVNRLPELLVVVEDVLYILTRREYDLERAFDLDTTENASAAD